MFGDDITQKVNKEAIIKFAREHPETREQYVKNKEAQGAEPYDFANDPNNAMRWFDQTYQWTKDNPLKLGFSNNDEFQKFIDAIVHEFRNFVENNGGWKLLWNDNETPRHEDMSQLLFLGIVKHYCAANNVDISKEANIGRGPVDFKVASGFTQRALIEVKLAKNTRFWHGLEKQLPKYLEAEGIHDGRFLVIVLHNKDTEKVKGIEGHVAAINAALPYKIICEIVDAERDPPSASKL